MVQHDFSVSEQSLDHLRLAFLLPLVFLEDPLLSSLEHGDDSEVVGDELGLAVEDLLPLLVLFHDLDQVEREEGLRAAVLLVQLDLLLEVDVGSMIVPQLRHLLLDHESELLPFEFFKIDQLLPIKLGEFEAHQVKQQLGNELLQQYLHFKLPDLHLYFKLLQ